MEEVGEIPVDIAKTLSNHLPAARQAIIRVGPEGSPISSVERPAVHFIGCDEGRDVVWYSPAGARGSAYDCGYDGSEKAAELVEKAINGINLDDGDSVSVDSEGNEEMITEVTSHLDR